MAFDILLIIVTLVALLIGSVSDLKTREVPDWITYGLIFAAFGIRIIFSLQLGLYVLLSGLLGFLVCLALAFLFYYSGQWGGGDSKLLMGMGAVVGITFPFDVSSFNLLWFFLALLFLGAIYGLLWMIVLGIVKHKIFFKNFKGYLRKRKSLHAILLIVTLIFIVLTFFKLFLWPMIFFPLGMFYVLSFVSIVEKSCFLKTIEPFHLTEGDWLAKDVIIQRKTVMEAKTLEKDDVWKLRFLEGEGKLKKVTIKEGVPFVPSFLFAYIFIIFFDSLLKVLETFLY